MISTMTHYRQIIVNVAVEDDAPDTVVEDLKEHIIGCVSDKTGKNGIKEIEVKVN